MLLLAGFTGLASCGPIPQPRDAFGAPVAAGGPIQVEVQNQRPWKMQIFAIRGHMRFLVGEVGPRERAQLRLPDLIADAGGELRLEADPVGSSQKEWSEAFELRDGRHIHWRLGKGGLARVFVQ